MARGRSGSVLAERFSQYQTCGLIDVKVSGARYGELRQNFVCADGIGTKHGNSLTSLRKKIVCPRDQNRSSTKRFEVQISDMEKILEDVATLFREVFTRELVASGYELVEEAGDDVLSVVPAIVNLDMIAPDRKLYVQTSRVEWKTSVSNRPSVRPFMTSWARALTAFLDDARAATGNSK